MTQTLKRVIWKVPSSIGSSSQGEELTRWIKVAWESLQSARTKRWGNGSTKLSVKSKSSMQHCLNPGDFPALAPTLKAAGGVTSKIQHHREKLCSLYYKCRWETDCYDESKCSGYDLLCWFTQGSSLHEWCTFISGVQCSGKNKHILVKGLCDYPWYNLSTEGTLL